MRTINSNISLDHAFWLRCKKAALDREISLNQLVKDGLRLALDDDEAIKVDRKGKASNDLKGVLKRKS